MSRFLEYVLGMASLGVAMGLLISCAVTKCSTNPTPEVKTITLETPYLLSADQESKWEKLGKELVTTQAKSINLNVSGFGGGIFYLERFLYRVAQAQAQGKIITGYIVAEADSASAILVCYLNKYYLTGRASLLFHAIRTSQGYDIGASGQRIQAAYLGECKRKGILTDKDIYTITVLHKRVIIDSTGKYVEDDEL